jgi:hypothetical protein
VLVETGFITNKEEEKLLRNAKTQEQIARAIFRGLKRYCDVEVSCQKEDISKAFDSNNLVANIRPGDRLLIFSEKFLDPVGRSDGSDKQSLTQSVAE